MRIFCILYISLFFFFFFNVTATTEIYTLSLHDALPIFARGDLAWVEPQAHGIVARSKRSEEHTSELQSPYDLVCSLLLEKKKNKTKRDKPLKKIKQKKKHKYLLQNR